VDSFSVSGGNKVGDTRTVTLAADVTATGYQWVRADVVNGVIGAPEPIAGQTAASYTLVQGDSGKAVWCVISGLSNPKTGAIITDVVPTAPVLVSAPEVNGTPTVGVASTFTASTWTGADSVTHKWQLGNDANGAGAVDVATTATYTPIEADIGKFLGVAETATNAAGSTFAKSTMWKAVQAALAYTVTKPLNFVFLGSSSTSNPLGTLARRTDMETEIKNRLTPLFPSDPDIANVKVYNEGVFGLSIDGLITNLPTVLAKYEPTGATPLDKNRTLFVVGIGANDFRNLLPYDSGDDAAIAAAITKLNNLLNTIDAAGWDWALSDFPYYDLFTYMEQSNRHQVDFRKFNDLIFNPVRAVKVPEKTGNRRVFSDNRSHMQWYEAVLYNAEVMSNDGYHVVAAPYSNSITHKEWTRSLIVPSWTGVSPADIRESTDLATLPVGGFAVWTLGDFITVKSLPTRDTVVPIPHLLSTTEAAAQLSRQAHNVKTGIRSSVFARRWGTINFSHSSGWGSSTTVLPLTHEGDTIIELSDVRTGPYMTATHIFNTQIKNLDPSGTYILWVGGLRDIAPIIPSDRRTRVNVLAGTGAETTGFFDSYRVAGQMIPHLALTLTPNAQGIIQFEAKPEATTGQTASLNFYAIKRIS
jgi:hypothetical protein